MQDEDIKAAAAAGIITETQAANLTILVHERAGRIAQKRPDDEPFELFSGFSEIFISIGLIILLTGAGAFSAVAGGAILFSIALIALCWWAATYFTLKRRMTLPSIVLVCGFAQGISLLLLITLGDGIDVVSQIIFGLVGIIAMLVHFKFFRVPFSMFVAGGFGFILTLAFFGAGLPDVYSLRAGGTDTFIAGGAFGLATLVFGLLALIAALWFDLRDPHRIGRLARSAFWLHLLAAPALVNTIMLTFYRLDGFAGTLLTLLCFAVIACFAIVIDRRSFLTSALGYVAAILFVALRGDEWGLGIPTFMLIIGVFMTSVGTFWTNLRVVLMNSIPEFPGKDRLPPYQETT